MPETEILQNQRGGSAGDLEEVCKAMLTCQPSTWVSSQDSKDQEEP